MSFRKRSVRTRIDLAAASDQMLLELTRDGTAAAFGELWSRHSDAVTAATRSFTTYEAEELAQEAFMKVYANIQNGGELPASFRAYVASTSRRLAIDRSRRDRGVVNVTYEDQADQEWLQQGDFSERVLDDSTTSQAFQSLPSRQREALWYRDVEDLPVQEIARYLGMSPNATSVLIKRAREAFKTAWIAEHLSPTRQLPEDCAAIVPKLAAHARQKLSETEQSRIDIHLLCCARCAALASEADRLHKQLALVLLPLFLLGGAPAYSAWIQSKQNRMSTEAAANEIEIVVQSGGGAGRPASIAASAAPAANRPAGVLVTLAVVSVLAVGASAFANGLFGETTSAGDTVVAGDEFSGRATPHLESGGDDGIVAGDVSTAGVRKQLVHRDGIRVHVPFELDDPDKAEDQRDPGSNDRDDTTETVDPETDDPIVVDDLDPQDPDTTPDPEDGDSDDPSEMVYPTPQALSFTIENSPFTLRVSATPGATVRITFAEANLPDVVVDLIADASGTVRFDFPDHRGKTVSGTLVQMYATATGNVAEQTDLLELEIPL